MHTIIYSKNHNELAGATASHVQSRRDHERERDRELVGRHRERDRERERERARERERDRKPAVSEPTPPLRHSQQSA